tara:strand:- start:2464 stop:2664 length:201 start_codon:yes stop_codon:yes gene_type:complete
MKIIFSRFSRMKNKTVPKICYGLYYRELDKNCDCVANCKYLTKFIYDKNNQSKQKILITDFLEKQR